MTEEQQTPIQVTTKNPKKVEAGKRLAEYNRRKREELKNATINIDETPTINRDESPPTINNTSVSTNNNNYVLGGVIALGLAGGFAYFTYKKKDSKPKSPQKSKIPVKINKLEMD